MLAFALTTLLPFAAAAPWFQPANSPVYELFKRGADPTSPTFATTYPTGWKTPNVSDIPQAWLDKLKTITLPNCPVASKAGNYNGADGMSADICSFTTGCHTKDDLFDGVDSTFVLTFDDGPTEASPRLTDFLKANNVSTKASHFMIGSNIISMPQQAIATFKNGGHLAVHTWSHPQMTTLSNEAIVAEIGFTLQAISDVTGGYLPLFWRPPYGDVDNRVRAIAQGVFGLTCVLWNRDTNDWQIGTNGHTVESVKGVMEGWWQQNKTSGILALEHELNNDTVQVFIDEYPNAAINGWSFLSVPEAFEMKWYQNAESNTAPISSQAVGEVNTIQYLSQITSAAPSSTVASSTAAANSTASAATSAGNAQNNKNSGASALVIPGAGALAAALLAALAL